MHRILKLSIVFSVLCALNPLFATISVAKDFDIYRGVSGAKLQKMLTQFSKFELAALGRYYVFYLNKWRDDFRKSPIIATNCRYSMKKNERVHKGDTRRRGKPARSSIMNTHLTCAIKAILDRKPAKAMKRLQRALKFTKQNDPASGLIHYWLSYVHAYGFGVNPSRALTLKYINEAKTNGLPRADALLQDLQIYKALGKNNQNGR